MSLISKAYEGSKFIHILCYRYQPDEDLVCVETCSRVYHYFISLCFDGLSTYLLFILQQKEMHKFKIKFT
jgi:hypothetical protein